MPILALKSREIVKVPTEPQYSPGSMCENDLWQIRKRGASRTCPPAEICRRNAVHVLNVTHGCLAVLVSKFLGIHV